MWTRLCDLHWRWYNCNLWFQVGRGFKSVHLEGMELKHMGQQTMGHYPIHFHTTGDVDEKGGYNLPTYVKDISIHHSFSRCVTVHGTNGLLVGFFITHCHFTSCINFLQAVQIIWHVKRERYFNCFSLSYTLSALINSKRQNIRRLHFSFKSIDITLKCLLR